MVLAATGAVAAVGGAVSQLVVDEMHESTQLKPMDPAVADAVAGKVLEMKCAACTASIIIFSSNAEKYLLAKKY